MVAVDRMDKDNHKRIPIIAIIVSNAKRKNR